MIGKRYIDGDKLMEQVADVPQSALPRVALRERLASWLKRQPRSPKLIGRERAAEILGVGSPYISQLTKAGKMPEPIQIEGGKNAYDEAEIKALAKQRTKEAAEKKAAADAS